MNCKPWIFAVLVSVFLGILSPAVAEATMVEQKNTDAEVTFAAASGSTLYFFEAPNLQFGTRSISMDDRYYGHHDTGSTKVVVDDIRGNNQGWRVMLSLSPFTATTGSPATLTNASIFFGKPDSVTSNYDPTPSPMPYLGDSSTVSSVEVKADSTMVKVLTAEADTGMARTTFEWQTTASAAAAENPVSDLANTKIELKVAGGSALARTYTAQLEWALYDTP